MPGFKNCICLIIQFCLFSIASAREITDMAGRRIHVPEKISRIYGVSPPVTFMIYSIDPGLVAALNYPARKNEKKMLQPEYTSLPVAGNIYGHGQGISMETIMMIKPDVAFFWAWKDNGINGLYAEKMEKAGIPSIFVDLDKLSGYPDVYRFLGDILDRKERCAMLAAYADETLKSVSVAVSGIPKNKKLKVYYAEGADGLLTERSGSVHAELVEMAGALNVNSGEAHDHYGMERVSLESVMLWNPDVILVQEREFYDSVMKDARWHGIDAVKNKKVYLIPQIPFNWFDRPPSFMRLLGLKWLTNLLYPAVYRLDINAETTRFYNFFIGLKPDKKQLEEITGL